MTTKDNFIYLTIALTALMLSMALSQQFFSPSAQRLTQSFTLVTLLIAVWGTKDDGKLSIQKALLLPILAIITSFIGYWIDSIHLQPLHLFFMLLFFILTAYKTAKQVLFSGDIDVNKILGAICLYMLIGLIWALLYTLSELYIPNSFNGINQEDVWYELLPTFIYFSFVTLTTLGYGDISPHLPLGQFLVVVQVVAGQFYMAVLVASLVGAHMSSRAEKISQEHSSQKNNNNVE